MTSPARDDRVLAAALFSWCAAIAAVDWALTGNAVIIGLLATGPLIAGAFGRPRVAAGVAAWAVALAIALGEPDMIFGTADHAIRVSIVAALGLMSIWLALSREDLERARFRDRLVADAGTAMSGALDHDVALIELARLAARRLSDWCFVFLREEDGSVRQVAVAHVDPDRQRLAWELLIRYPLDPGRPEGPAKAIRTGRSELLREVSDHVLRAMAADEENLRLLKALGLRSAMITPLVARGRILGAIAFASAESGRLFGPDDLALAEDLTARAAVIVDNARLYVRLREAEQELRDSHIQLEAILGGVADSVTAQAPDGSLIYANDAAARLLGLDSAAELLAADMRAIMARYELLMEDGRPFPFDELPGRRALAGEDPAPALVRYRNVETGEERWSQIKATAIRDESGTPVLAINVIEDVTDQREREETQRFLADVGAALAASLDIDATFPVVASLAARQIADWCAIEVFEPHGGARTIGFGHAQPEGAGHAEELMRRYPLGRQLAGPSGEARLRADLTDAELDAIARDPEHLSLLRMLRPRSAVAVPLRVRGRTLGMISLITAESRRRLDDDDLLLAEVFAGRCALALDNARLYDERSRIARTLQESLLPPLLPELPGLDVAARFRAAGAGLEVGGDFYDLFQVGEAGWAVAIGDVCGKGTGAAAVTALARYTVRAAAMRQDDPSQILALLNEALLTQREDRRFATVLYGCVSGNGNGHGAPVSFEFASGGHPLPLVLTAENGGAHEVGAPGTLLGVVGNPSLRSERVSLDPGDAVVLYTDGVTDAGAPDQIFTPEQLSAAVGSTTGLDADTIAEQVLRTALGAVDGEPRDDIAIIVLKVPDQAPR
jgi:PAS domain S-box-containing protein